MFYVLGDGCLDAVVKKGDVDLRWKIFSGTNVIFTLGIEMLWELKFTMMSNVTLYGMSTLRGLSWTLKVRYLSLSASIDPFAHLVVESFCTSGIQILLHIC